MHGEDGRSAHRALHRRRGVHAEPVRRVHRPHHAGSRQSDAHVEEVDQAEGIEARADLGRVLRGEAGAVALLLVAHQA